MAWGPGTPPPDTRAVPLGYRYQRNWIFSCDSPPWVHFRRCFYLYISGSNFRRGRNWQNYRLTWIGEVGMISYNFPNIAQKSSTGILINQHVTGQADEDITGFNIQYLRRMLRSGVLEIIKIGKIWLIEMKALEAYLQHSESTSDDRCSPRQFVWWRVYICRRLVFTFVYTNFEGGKK